MTEANQKILYENFKRLSVDGTTDIQRKNCAKYAKDILGSFPQFAKKEEPKEIEKPLPKAKGK